MGSRFTMDPKRHAPPSASLFHLRFGPNMPRVEAWGQQEAWKLRQLKSMTHPGRQEYIHICVCIIS